MKKNILKISKSKLIVQMSTGENYLKGFSTHTGRGALTVEEAIVNSVGILIFTVLSKIVL